MNLNNIFKKKFLFITFLFFFSFLFNQYYGNRGVFPTDSFSHFDTGYRILIGEYPFKDYWIVSGPVIDYIQSLFFYLFGINWQAYVFHASLFNSILTIATFLILMSFNLTIIYSFIYSILFSILAYPVSGTPFVDLHSTFFSLLSIYSLIMAIKKEKAIYWILFPVLLGLAFFSKQVPTMYIAICIFIILFLFSILKKKFYWIKYSLLGTFLFFILIFLVGYISGIKFNSFLEQYIYYPQSVGESRFKSFNFTFRGVVDHFKYIYLAILPIFYLNLKKLFFEKNYLKKNDFYYFLCIFFLTFSLIVHQLLTKNQTFIFFLIPILMAFSHINLNLYNISQSRVIFSCMILICTIIVIKYHLRFNENRKFHELSQVNFELTIPAKNISRKFVGLKWITPKFKENPRQEIEFLNEAKFYLNKDDRNKMLITNYSFFSAILDQKFFSPSRWWHGDGSSYPKKNNQYFIKFKNLWIDLVKKNDVKVIYTIFSSENPNIVYKYIDKNCFIETKVTKFLRSYELKSCDEING